MNKRFHFQNSVFMADKIEIDKKYGAIHFQYSECYTGSIFNNLNEKFVIKYIGKDNRSYNFDITLMEVKYNA